MSLKKRTWMLLLLILVFGIGLAIFGMTKSMNQTADETIPSAGVLLGMSPPTTASTRKIQILSELPNGSVSHVEVVYFHRTERCPSCVNAENYTRETIEKYFADQVKRGLLSLRVLDVEKVQNAPWVNKFDAAGSSLHLSIIVDATEYLCPIQDIWLYTNNKYLFVNRLKEKLAALVGES